MRRRKRPAGELSRARGRASLVPSPCSVTWARRGGLSACTRARAGRAASEKRARWAGASLRERDQIDGEGWPRDALLLVQHLFDEHKVRVRAGAADPRGAPQLRLTLRRREPIQHQLWSPSGTWRPRPGTCFAGKPQGGAPRGHRRRQWAFLVLSGRTRSPSPFCRFLRRCVPPVQCGQGLTPAHRHHCTQSCLRPNSKNARSPHSRLCTPTRSLCAPPRALPKGALRSSRPRAERGANVGAGTPPARQQRRLPGIP